jgi:hypothetical protein
VATRRAVVRCDWIERQSGLLVSPFDFQPSGTYGHLEVAGVLERGRHQRDIGESPRLRELLRDLCRLLSFPLRLESNAEAIK